MLIPSPGVGLKKQHKRKRSVGQVASPEGPKPDYTQNKGEIRKCSNKEKAALSHLEKRRQSCSETPPESLASLDHVSSSTFELT